MWCSDFRSWQAESVDSGCSNCTQTSPPYPEPFCGDPLAGHMFATQAGQYGSGKMQPPPLKVMREDTAAQKLPGTVSYCCACSMTLNWPGEKRFTNDINNPVWVLPSWQLYGYWVGRSSLFRAGFCLFSYYLLLNRIWFLYQKTNYFYCGRYLIYKCALVSISAYTWNCNRKDDDQIPVLFFL